MFYRDYVHYKGQLSEIGLCGSPRERNLSYQGVKFSYHSSTSDIPLIKNIIVGLYVNGSWQRFHDIDIIGGLLEGGRISSLLHNERKIEKSYVGVDKSEKPYKLTIVAIAKNEANYISEWCAYHKLMGVERIYLYENDSTDNMRDVLKPYEKDGFVECIEIHGKQKQIEAYNDAITKFGGESKYMAFIDCDEFMLPMDERRTLLDEVESIFSQDENCGGIGLNWCLYGSSGHVEKPNGLVIENYLKRAPIEFEESSWIKSIVKPEMVETFVTPHHCIYKSGHYCINYNGDFIPSFWNIITCYQGVRINHYFCKSRDEYVSRRSYGRADIKQIRPMSDFYKYDRNDIYDDQITKYVKDVKTIMEDFTNR